MPNLNLTYPTDQNLRPKDISEWLGLITSTIGDLKGENWYNFTTFTLKQLTQAINNDPNFATTMNNALATKLNASAYTATDVLNKLKTVDGSGSGLDADTVRGYVPVNKAGDTMTGFLTLYGDPTQALHAATKQYVDTLMQTFSVKTAVRAATTANITLSGTQTIDGVALVVGDRVLVKNQTDAKQNGIYVVQSGAWVRANDADTDPKLTNGLIVFVKEGNENGNRGWILTTDNPITVGATPLNFEQFSGAGQITAGAGLTKSGDTLSLANSGVTTGTYTKVTVDVYGRVTSGTTLSASDIPALDWSKITTGKPTTLAGYGITDSVNVSEVVTAPAPNKILKLDGNSKLPASITGNADGNAATASKLQTARTISLSGDTTGSVSFDGSANVTIATTLTNSGVTAGTYTKVTVDAKGRVTSGSTLLASDIPSLDWSKITTGKPTTLSGYGITDAVPIKTVSATTPTTSGWYRIATSPINIGPNDALFTVEWFGGVEKGRAIFYARCTDGIPKTTEIQQAAYSSITNNDITKARIVYNTTATGNYAYVEIFKPSSQALTVNVTITNPTGWSTVSPNTTGSIPSGYTSIETTFGGAINASKDIITTAKLVGQQLESIASSGTPPLIIASTTKVNNLNVDMVDDYHVNTGTTANTIPIRDGSGNLPGNITGNAATATKLQTARTISISGDVSANGISFDGSGDVALSATLVNTGVAPGTYTKVTVDSKGRVTSGSTLLASDIPSLDWSKITTGKPTTLAGYGITDGVNISEVVTSPTPNKILRLDANSKLPASITGNADGNAATASKLQTSRTISLSGDVSGSVSFDGSSNVTISSTLANTGVVSGTYTKVTVDSKGRVTSATTLAASDIPNLDWSKITTGKPTTLAGYGITDAAHATHNHDSVYLKLSGGTMTGPLTLSGDPTQALHAATKQYVDGLIQGLRRRTSIRAATTGNITLSGIQSIDGVTLSVGDRVLVKNQTNPVENGIYIVQSGTWTRATDFDDSTDLDGSVFVFVEQGTTQAETGWVLASDDSVVIGRDPISWVQFSSAGIVNGDAITIVKSGNILSLKSGVVSAGTYPKVTVDTYGRVTAGSPLAASDIPNLDWSKITTGKPTTLAGYGITDAVNISEVVSSPTANKILRLDSNGKLPASITGDAASVGGFSQDRILVDRGSDTNDWNTITTQGVYRVGRTDWTGVNGAPTNAYSFGTLVVVQNGNSVSQIYYPHNTVGKGVFTRTKWNASDWGPWEKYWTDRNMGPGSGLDADTVDGKNLSQLIQNDVNDQTIQGRGSLVRLSILNSTDTGETELVVAGNPANGQGTGRVYVGQDPTLYGGGIEYNGDANPAGSGAGTDYFALFRVDNGNKYWTARNFYSNNDWEFRGWVTAPNIKATATTGGLVVGDGTTGEIKVGSTTLTGQGDSTLRVTTSANGYVEIGPKSTEYAHFNTDRQYYYFNKNILVMGYRALTTNDTGSGKGLDSDTTDGLHATSFVRSDAIDDVDYRLNFNNNLAEKAPYQAGPVTLWKHRNLASYTSTSPSDAGAFVIECPFGFISTMMKVTIEGYFYDSTGPFKTEVGFYPYSSNKTFYNYGFVNYGKKNLRVRLARKISTGNVVIILGDEASSYSYPQLHVTDFIQGYSATGSNLGDGWKIYKETNLTGYDTIVDVPDQTDVAYAQNANMLDGIDSTGFLRRNVDTDTTGKITITRDGDAIVLNKDTTTSYSGITFNSKCNPGSDYAYIRYYDDVSNFYAPYDNGSSSENSALVIGVENDGVNSHNDYLVLRGPTKIILDAFADAGPSERVAEFRRQGTIVSHIDNTGKYMGDVDTLDGLHASSFMRSDQPNTSTIGNLSVGGQLTVSTTSTLNDVILTIAPTSGNAGIELGGKGHASTPYIDFHSGVTTVDYDVRLLADHGTGTNGGADLIIYTSHLKATNNASIANHLAVGTNTVDSTREVVIQQSGTVNTNGLAILASGAGNVGGYLWSGTGGFVIDSRSNNFTGSKNIHLQTGGVDRLFIDGSSGNIGIGTSSPAQRLHVAGNVRMTGNFFHDGTGPLPFLTDTAAAKPIQTGGLLVSNDYSDQSQVPTNGAYIKGEIKGGGNLTIPGVVKLSKMVYQVTFAPGETTKTITHNLGTTNYMCTLGANSVARHVAWANKAVNTIDIVIDDAYPFGSITVDVILMAY